MCSATSAMADILAELGNDDSTTDLSLLASSQPKSLRIGKPSNGYDWLLLGEDYDFCQPESQWAPDGWRLHLYKLYDWWVVSDAPGWTSFLHAVFLSSAKLMFCKTKTMSGRLTLGFIVLCMSGMAL